MEKKWILLLRLEAPLQSYGERAKWDFRDTAYFPTKSGVIGMLACAMGLRRGSSDIISLTENLEVNVRADIPGNIIIDFHTIKAVFINAKGELRTAAGVKKGEPSVVISKRQYIEDASFLVAVCGDYALLERCREALLDPVWPPFLGRKSCIPTRPVFEALTDAYGSAEDAFLKNALAERSVLGIHQCQYETPVGNMLRRDAVIGDRTFAYRQIYQDTVETEVST